MTKVNDARLRGMLAHIGPPSSHLAVSYQTDELHSILSELLELRAASKVRTIREGGHACGYCDIGSYEGQVELVPPPFLARSDGRGICVDVCLALEISRLWALGIKTTGCCCGHGKLPAFIGVTEEHIPAMKAMGYSVQPNPMRPGDEDSFVPKTPLRAIREGDGEWVSLAAKLKDYDDAVRWHSYRPHDVNRETAQHKAAAELADVVRAMIAATPAAVTAENARLREALNLIDALDPEEHIYGTSHDACRGLIIRMGQMARAALSQEAPK